MVSALLDRALDLAPELDARLVAQLLNYVTRQQLPGEPQRGKLKVQLFESLFTSLCWAAAAG